MAFHPGALSGRIPCMDLSGTADTQDSRLRQAFSWLEQQGYARPSESQSVAGDASFRRYFRLWIDGAPKILMDAPPPKEDIRPFLDIAGRLRSAGLYAPEIFAADTHNGFILIEDLGDDLYREQLSVQNADDHFPAMFSLLKDLALKVETDQLPEFDTRKLQTEMNLFPDWYLGHHRKQAVHEQFDSIWKDFCQRVIESARAQPQGFVHRDFHSCNLLKTRDDRIGIIDFQDAVRGPLSYDFISLVWDRYIPWPRNRIEAWIEDFRRELELDIDPQQWLRDCDLMGLQRNIKIIGIFARLHYRDGKDGYLELIPRFYQYVTSTLGLYPEFSDMLKFMEQSACEP
jgi:aminoglycoside/choline kinase family phosphotransferase